MRFTVYVVDFPIRGGTIFVEIGYYSNEMWYLPYENGRVVIELLVIVVSTDAPVKNFSVDLKIDNRIELKSVKPNNENYTVPYEDGILYWESSEPITTVKYGNAVATLTFLVEINRFGYYPIEAIGVAAKSENDFSFSTINRTDGYISEDVLAPF